MLSIVEIDESNRDYWDKEISKFETVHPLNAFGWGKVRAIDGWSPTYLMAKRGESVIGAVMILTKRIPLCGLSIMYAPRGPVFNLSDKETLRALLERIRMEAKKSHAIFLRIDPNINEDAILRNDDLFTNEGFIHLKHRWSFWNTPRDVYRIDLTKVDTEDELFKSLDRQARKAVRKARKQGVTIQQARSLNEIMICLIFGNKCLAMHMGTLYKYQHLRTNDAYVWEAIRWAKENGCRWFSFRGVGTTPTQERFKRKFAPKVVCLAGYYDFAFRPFFYSIFYFVEFSILPRAWGLMINVRKIYHRIRKMLRG
jgi:lipid II:glycine glycyltransferase (peptidoglycan interpeptide bridge formation enzyme)